MKIRDLVFRLMQCREAQEAASRELDGGLGWGTKGLLRLHCRFCWCCQRFSDQIRLLRGLLRSAAEDPDWTAGAKLSAPGRERIRQALREARREDPGHSA